MYDHGSNGGMAYLGMGLASTGVGFHVSTVVWVAILLLFIGLAAVMATRRTRRAKVKP